MVVVVVVLLPAKGLTVKRLVALLGVEAAVVVAAAAKVAGEAVVAAPAAVGGVAAAGVVVVCVGFFRWALFCEDWVKLPKNGLETSQIPSRPIGKPLELHLIF